MLKLIIVCFLIYILPSPTSPLSQGQEHLFLHLLYLPKACHWHLETALSTGVFSHYSARIYYLKKNQLPSSIILKNQLISGIHDKTVLHLHSSYPDFNCLIYQGLLRRFQAAIPQLLSLHRKDTAEVTLQSIVSGFFPWWDECLG